MSLSEIFGWTATLLTVFALLRWKQSERAAHNFPRYSHSSRPTEARQTLIEPDRIETDRTFHVSVCQHCQIRASIPLSETALERRPWRIAWKCGECGNTALAAVPREMIKTLLYQDRPGGMRISVREYRDFTGQLEDVEQAIYEELL